MATHTVHFCKAPVRTVRGPEAGGAVSGHGHKGPRGVEAAHQAPHVQIVARERAAQPVPGGAARHGPGPAWGRPRESEPGVRGSGGGRRGPQGRRGPGTGRAPSRRGRAAGKAPSSHGPSDTATPTGPAHRNSSSGPARRDARACASLSGADGGPRGGAEPRLAALQERG